MKRNIKILASILLAQTVYFNSNALSAEDKKETESLSQLTPPLSVKGGLVTGEGKERDGELVVKNDGARSISAFVIDMLLLRTNGTVGDSILHTQSGIFGHNDANTLASGERYAFKVGSIFVKNDISAVDGVVTKITFSDNATWPSMPSTPPEKKNGEPVAVKMIGVMGSGQLAVPVVALFNYGPKGVHEVHYNIEYLDSLGKVLKKTNYGSAESVGKTLMESGTGMVESGGDAPPDKTVAVRSSVTDVTFSDLSEWKQGK